MKKKNILIALLMLLLTGVALSTATYAWFTANTRLDIGAIDVKVTAQQGILMSTDAVNWKSILTTGEIIKTSVVNEETVLTSNYTGETNQFPTVLEPVSSIGTTLGSCSDNTSATQAACEAAEGTWTAGNGKFNMFYGKLQDGSTTNLSLVSATEAHGFGGYYVAFDLFIQLSSGTGTMELLNTSSVTAVNVTTPANSAVDTNLRYAARVGFLNKGNASTSADAIALNDSIEATIWEPIANKHTDAAIAQGLASDNVAITTLKGAKAESGGTCTGGTATGEETTSTACAAAGGTWTPAFVVIDNATQFGSVTANLIQTTAAQNATEFTGTGKTLFSISQGITKVRFYIWIEGQDVDCANDISLGSGIRIKLDLVKR